MRAGRWSVAVASLVLLWGTAGPGAGREKPGGPPDRQALDESASRVLLEVLDEGADLYNADYPSACSYLFQGALMSVQASLDHRPELQTVIRTGVAAAKRQSDMSRRAWALRGVIVRVRSALRPGRMPRGEGKTLWDRLGGERKVTKIVDDFLKGAMADKSVNFTRRGAYQLGPPQLGELRGKLVHLASAVTGGPHPYTGKSMKEVHKGMGITDAEFDAAMKQLRIALRKNDVDDKDAEVLLKHVETTRKSIVERKGQSGQTTLWDRLGGERKVTKIVDDFLKGAMADKSVNFTRRGAYQLGPPQLGELRGKLVHLASAVTGGPHPYTGKSMKEVHKGMGITDAEFDAAMKQLRIALRKNDVDDKDAEVLLKHVETTRKNIVESTRKMQKPDAPAATLWDRLGGEEKVKEIVADFVDAVIADKTVNFSRNGAYKLGPDQLARLKRHLVDLASELGKGPRKYRGKSMKVAHKGMGITDAEFDALIGHLKAVLKKHGVKRGDADSLLEAVEGTRKNIVEKAADKQKTRTRKGPSSDQISKAASGEERPAKQTRSQAEPLLDKAIKAMGGEARLAKLETGTWKGKFRFRKDLAKTNNTGTLQSAWHKEGQYRVAFDAHGDRTGKVLVVINGDKGWFEWKGLVTELPGESLSLTKEGLDGLRLPQLLPALKDKKLKRSYLDEIKVNDRPAVGLRVVSGRKEIRLFFFFTKLTARMDDRELTAELTEIKPRDKLDKSLFAKPREE